MFLPQNIDDCLNDLHKLLKCESAVVSCYKVNNEFNKNNTTKEATLVDSVMAILGINDYEKIDKNTKLTELGMDSLQSASIKTTLKKYGKKTGNYGYLIGRISGLSLCCGATKRPGCFFFAEFPQIYY
jgi:hypothetical protein